MEEVPAQDPTPGCQPLLQRALPGPPATHVPGSPAELGTFLPALQGLVTKLVLLPEEPVLLLTGSHTP